MLQRGMILVNSGTPTAAVLPCMSLALYTRAMHERDELCTGQGLVLARKCAAMPEMAHTQVHRVAPPSAIAQAANAHRAETGKRSIEVGNTTKLAPTHSIIQGPPEKPRLRANRCPALGRCKQASHGAA